MKFNLLLVFSLVFLLASCGDDEDGCSQADWVGTYTGTETCDGTTVDATIVVAAVGEDMLSMTFTSSGSTIEIPGVPFDACGVSEELSLDTSTLDVDASLDGSNLTIDTEFMTLFGNASCQYVVTR